MSELWLSDRFMLLMSGKLRAGLSHGAASLELQRQLQVSEAQAGLWLQGGWQLLRVGLDAGEAHRQAGLLSDAGIESHLHRMTSAEKAYAIGDRERAASMRALESYHATLPYELLATHPELKSALEALSVPAKLDENWKSPGKLPCPCCQTPTLNQRSVGEECTVCGWRDYQGQNEYHPDKVVAGRNFGLSLDEARLEFEAHGSIDPQNYMPNEVPLHKRVTNILVALFILAYCSYSLWIDQLYFPFINRYAPGQSKVILFRGIDAWVMAGAMLCAVLFCVLSVADHYDRRRNERHYQKAVQTCMLLFTVFMGLALTMHLYRAEGLGTALWMVAGLLTAIGALIVRFRQGPIDY